MSGVASVELTTRFNDGDSRQFDSADDEEGHVRSIRWLDAA
jgi:hypothetical protein